MPDINIKDAADFWKATGSIQSLSHTKAYSELLKYAIIFKEREKEEYKKFGMTWEQYCTEIIGEPKRTVNEKLKDIRPIVDSFQASLAQISSIPFNKIRYLGRISGGEGANLPTIENDKLIIDGASIPITSENKDEIEAAIDALIDAHKQEKEALQKKLDNQEKKFERNVEERTKELAAELEDTKAAKEHFKDEIDRLKPYDIEQMDISEADDLIREIQDISVKFEVKVRKFQIFVKDQRLEESLELQVEIQNHLYRTYRAIKDLREEWDTEFYPDIEE